MSRTNLRRLVTLVALILGASGRADAEPRIGYLRCLSEPQGAYVFLDGAWLGVTPLGPIGVVEGTHTLWFRSRPGTEFEAEPVPPRTITVAVGDTVRVNERMGHLVWIESTPPGAEISVDGRVVGNTPLQVRVDLERISSIVVGGGEHRRASIDLDRLGERDRIFVGLERRPSAPTFDEPRLGSRSASWAPWASFLVAGGSAAVAVYFKERADDAFERYEQSLLVEEITDWRDRADRDDRYATAAWIVAESALALGVYLLARPLFTGGDDDAADVVATAPRFGWSVDYDDGRTELGARVRW